jgi:hypothetical protein
VFCCNQYSRTNEPRICHDQPYALLLLEFGKISTHASQSEPQLPQSLLCSSAQAIRALGFRQKMLLLCTRTTPAGQMVGPRVVVRHHPVLIPCLRRLGVLACLYGANVDSHGLYGPSIYAFQTCSDNNLQMIRPRIYLKKLQMQPGRHPLPSLLVSSSQPPSDGCFSLLVSVGGLLLEIIVDSRLSQRRSLPHPLVISWPPSYHCRWGSCSWTPSGSVVCLPFGA